MPRVLKIQSDVPNGACDICLTAIKDTPDVVHPQFENTKLPYEFTFTAKLEDGTKVKITEQTSGVMSAKDWKKRFYRGEDKNGNPVTRFSRYYTLNALLEIFRAKKDKQVLAGDATGEFDIDLLLKKSFIASVVVDTKNDEPAYEPFINWIDTFEANGVPVWDAVNNKWMGESTAGHTTMQEKALGVNPKEAAAAIDDDLDLPF